MIFLYQGSDEQPTKRQANDQNSSKKKRTKVIDMILENAPKDGKEIFYCSSEETFSDYSSASYHSV